MLSIRRSTREIPHQRAHLSRVLAAACQPRVVRSLSEWADEHRVLTSKGSGEPGKWRTSRTPYLREILDSLSAHDPTQRLVLRFAAQLGKTEVGLNWIGYVMSHAPAPMLVVLPTLEVRKRWVRQRLDPMLTDTPAIRVLFDARARRDGANAEDMKDFPGGLLVVGGANSPASLSSMPIRYVLCDEIDRFPWEAGAEGDPLGLVDERTKTFPRRKVVLVSTPTVAGLSRIDDEYNLSDRREYEVPCPHCGERQVLRFRGENGELNLRRNEATGVVYYKCVHCAERIDEHHKPEMLAWGRWVARAPGRQTRGYALNGLYSPLGLGFSWRELWDKWQEAHGDVTKLKRFVNTTLGEVYEEEGDSVDPLGLIARLEDYPKRIPAGLRTAGVDVQKNRLEVTVVDWGAEEQCWVREHLVLWGDTALPPIWEDLEEELQLQKVGYVAVDSGYNAPQVYAFCQGKRWAYPIKGMSGPGRDIVEDERKRRYRKRARARRSVEVYVVGVDQAKALLYARMKLREAGPGYIHFPRLPWADDEYFAQISAEKLITKVRGTRGYTEWVKTRARNEALDCLIYALAAARLSGQRIKSKLEKSQEEKDTDVKPQQRGVRERWNKPPLIR